MNYVLKSSFIAVDRVLNTPVVPIPYKCSNATAKKLEKRAGYMTFCEKDFELVLPFLSLLRIV